MSIAKMKRELAALNAKYEDIISKELGILNRRLCGELQAEMEVILDGHKYAGVYGGGLEKTVDLFINNEITETSIDNDPSGDWDGENRVNRTFDEYLDSDEEQKPLFNMDTLTKEEVLSLLSEKYRRPEEIADEVLKKNIKPGGKFKNGNQLIFFNGHHTTAGVIDTKNNLLCVFCIYDPGAINYKPKHDVFMITAHETLTEVSSNGEIDVDYTR